MNTPAAPSSDQNAMMAEMEIAALKEEIAALRQELDELRSEADLDACHIAGLSAQIKALIAESEACPNREAHPLIERVDYVNSRTGQPMTKTRALPIYREAFDAEARRLDIEDPENFRS